MKAVIFNVITAMFGFLSMLMIAAAAGMMDQGAEISVCIKLVICAVLSMITAAGVADLRRL